MKKIVIGGIIAGVLFGIIACGDAAGEGSGDGAQLIIISHGMAAGTCEASYFRSTLKDTYKNPRTEEKPLNSVSCETYGRTNDHNSCFEQFNGGYGGGKDCVIKTDGYY